MNTTMTHRRYTKLADVAKRQKVAIREDRLLGLALVVSAALLALYAIL